MEALPVGRTTAQSSGRREDLLRQIRLLVLLTILEVRRNDLFLRLSRFSATVDVAIEEQFVLRAANLSQHEESIVTLLLLKLAAFRNVT
jgi:hypothetical protein